PEMLCSNVLAPVLELPDFQRRQVAIMVDEAHLMYVWGRSFRTQYTQIGFVRQRFSASAPLVAFTATLRRGRTPEQSPLDCVRRFLGFDEGSYHFIHRSCARYEMQITVRPFSHGRQSEAYPELDWLLGLPGKTLVFCSSIKWGAKIALYLLSKSPGASLKRRPRTYSRLQTDEHNNETLELLLSPSKMLVIATDTLAVGIDIPDILTVIIIEPEDLDDAIQKGGRSGRDASLVPHPRAVIYLPSRVYNDPQSVLDNAEATASQGSKRIDTSLAELALASCKLRSIDEQYGNDPDEPPCSCTRCTLHPRALFPSNCDCSGCQPE
ncbi:P-loop containing nucleoside triphosphate hydrolase protein, partial [Schizophyllum amplum]